MPKNSLLSVYGRIHLLAYGMILIRYLIWGRGHVCVFSTECCRSMLAAKMIRVTGLPVSLLSALTMWTGKVCWAYDLDPPLLAYVPD